jgi:hypothetical protein
MAAESFGVLIDFGARRNARGVPSYFDGWYASEERWKRRTSCGRGTPALGSTSPASSICVSTALQHRLLFASRARLGGGPRDKKSTLLARAWLKPR